ncbi:MAG: NAD(P)-dependent oxidoreductase [Bacteroidetes bacterium]|nr:NAD(P)-dependent oxidoreductase [Bacteroidota bacterium]
MSQNNKHAVITGSAGFIGSHLTMALLAKGYRVTGIDNLSHGSARKMASFSEQQRFNFIEADAGKIEDLILAPVDLVIHLASEKIPRYSTGLETAENNLRVSDAVIRFALEKKARLYFASTSDVYGKNPNVPFHESSDCVFGSSLNKRWVYAGSKYMTELKLAAAARSKGLEFQIMRFFGCYGPGMNPGWRSGPQQVFFESALAGKAPEIHGDGKQSRVYVFIDDLIRGIIQLIEHEGDINEIWNFCPSPDEEISVLALAEKIYGIVKPECGFKPEFVPYESFGAYEDVRRRTGDASKAKRKLGWQALTPLQDGLELTHQWMMRR